VLGGGEGAVLRGIGNKRSRLRRPLMVRAGDIRGEGNGWGPIRVRCVAANGGRSRGGGGYPIGAAHSRAGAPDRQRRERDRGGQRSGARHQEEEWPGANRRAPGWEKRRNRK
jgi:hypothetical protein